MHGASDGVSPELVLCQVDDHQPDDQHHGCQFALVANHDADHQSGTDDVLNQLQETEIEKNKYRLLLAGEQGVLVLGWLLQALYSINTQAIYNDRIFTRLS